MGLLDAASQATSGSYNLWADLWTMSGIPHLGHGSVQESMNKGQYVRPIK